MGEDRTASEAERVGVHLEDVRPGDVAGQQIRRELDPTERRDPLHAAVALDRLAEGAGEGGLTGARKVLEEDVAVREEGGQDQIDHLVAAADRGPEPLLEAARDLGRDLEASAPGAPLFGF